LAGNEESRRRFVTATAWITPEKMGLVLCLGLSSVLSLFYQNKLDDVSLYDWMLQKRSFADVPDVRGSLCLFIVARTDNGITEEKTCNRMLESF
jgi:hypothetical protein